MEQKNDHIYQQMIYSWENPTLLLDLIKQFPSEFKTDPFLVAVTHHHECFNQVDLEKSRKIYIDLVAQNHPGATNNLAGMYHYGQGVEIDFQKAIELYERAVELNQPNAIMTLAHMYQNGEGVAVDYQKSIQLYQQGMNLGHAGATNNLAYIYSNGKGVPVDYQKAIELYERAIELKSSNAMYNLAVMYEHNQNLSRAFDLYLRGKYMDEVQRILNDCSNLQEKMDLFKICLKHDYHPEHIRIYITILREMWLINIVDGVFPHQKHPLYNRHMDSLIAKYM